METITLTGLQPKEGRLFPFFSPEENYTCGCYGATYGIYSPNTALLPFVLNLPLKNVRAFPVTVYNALTNKAIVCFPSSSIPHLLYKIGDSYAYVYSGASIDALRISDGTMYYVEMLGFKSCTVIARVETDCFVRVELSNRNELFGLPYHRGWSQWVYVDSELESYKWASYTVQDKDELGRTSTTQSRLEKIWNVELFDLPEHIYQTLHASAIIDTITLKKGIVEVVSRNKRGTADLDKGITCERTITLSLPDTSTEQSDGVCNTVDNWLDVDTELPVDACLLDMWVETGRTRCVPVGFVAGCNPKPNFTASVECLSSAGFIRLTALSVPATEKVEYSIDDGSTFKPDGSFTGLIDGIYNTRIRHVSTGCLSTRQPITVNCAGTNPGVINWEKTGVGFCLETQPNTISWEKTGNGFCLAITTVGP